MTVTIRHNKVDLALHPLRDGVGRPLLLLHGLGERSPHAVPDHLSSWFGPVWALDFTGHGASSVPPGAGYYCELLMADADAALAHLGPSTVYGRGLGAYVALLIAGSRPDLVRGAVLDDGPGLVGGGTEPGTSFVLGAPLPAGGTPDPYALLELSQHVLLDTGAVAQVEELIVVLTSRAVDAIEAADVTAEARDELVDLAWFVASRDA